MVSCLFRGNQTKNKWRFLLENWFLDLFKNNVHKVLFINLSAFSTVKINNSFHYMQCCEK